MILIFVGILKVVLWLACLYLANRWTETSRSMSRFMLFGPRILIPKSLKEKSRHHIGFATLVDILVFLLGALTLLINIVFIFAAYFVVSYVVDFFVCKISGGDFVFWVNHCTSGIFYKLGIN